MKTSPIRRSINHGFTIVELLIVIVVIGILGALVIVGYNGIKQRATTVSYVSAMDQWEKLVRSEYALTGKIPPSPGGGWTCVGNSINNFPAVSGLGSGVCGTLDDEFGNHYEFTYDQSYINQFSNKSNFKSGGLPDAQKIRLDNGELHMRGIIMQSVSVSGETVVNMVWYPETKNNCGRGVDEWSSIDTIRNGGCSLTLNLK